VCNTFGGGVTANRIFLADTAHIIHPFSTLIFIIYISKQQKKFRLYPSRFEKVIF